MEHNKTQTSVPVRRLGRGLSALIGTPVSVEPPTGPAVGAGSAGSAERAEKSGGEIASGGEAAGPGGEGSNREVGRIVYILLDHLIPSPHQPRKVFDEQLLAELALSIKAAGVVQPVVVRERTGPGASVAGEKRYELVAGERRWRAARIAGLTHIPAVVAVISDEQAAEWALIENLQRADLSAMEKADALQLLGTKFRLTHGALAQRVGIDRSSVTNLIRLTELEEPIRAMLHEGTLTAGHGKALLACITAEQRETLARKAVREGWSVRKLEDVVVRSMRDLILDAGVSPSTEPVGKTGSEIGLQDLEKQLGDHLGTKVRVRAGKRGKNGTLVISFYDLDHFDGLMAKMGFVMR